MPVGDGATGDDIVLSGVFSQQDAYAAEQDSMEGNAMMLCQGAQVLTDRFIERKIELCSGVIDLWRAREIGGQLEALKAGELCFPVSELPVKKVTGEMATLPDGVIFI